MGRRAQRRTVLHVEGDGVVSRQESLAVEEPLELRVAGTALTVTMRTPGDDMDLAAGFLVAEGAVKTSTDIVTMRYCGGKDDDGLQTYNQLDLELAVPAPTPRAFATTSACGVCGSDSIEEVRQKSPYQPLGGPLERRVLTALPARMQRVQREFRRTGGLHAAGLFSLTGELLCLREDVGRHNAVDKVVGWALREDRLPLSDTVLLVSGRASFELVQKAWMAGIPALAAISAPSSLAVTLAEEAGMTLVGFLRGDTMNVYTGADRLLT
ncbi:MAG: formate dehydrogenase accessory sulfurtransferase FdhD [Mycobacteriales bacterium]